ncbi:hypothetical protein DFH06DRAFT_1475758 [Mycena polygramma]|nr:hypothetical protein DFH06DRAFT_1475758 [Mycena polygramma]
MKSDGLSPALLALSISCIVPTAHSAHGLSETSASLYTIHRASVIIIYRAVSFSAMPSALSSPESQRSWWPMSQKSPSSSQVFPEKPHSHSKQSGIKFNTLATAMGFKPKKSHPPPLTIHEPYPPVRTVVTPPVSHLAPRIDSSRRPYTAPSAAGGRPPSNSVSSRADSIEPSTPRTPEDISQARRGSLLTLSDADPFAARVVSLHSPDPNRLSAFSNSSGNDRKSSHESANRVSYASSSSQSFRMGGDLSPLSAVSPVSDAGSSSYMKLTNKLSGPSLRRKDVSSDSWLSDLGAGESNRLSQPDPPPQPRPAMRARGLTDAGIERTNFLRNDPFIHRVPSHKSSSSKLSSPKPLARQISLARPAPPPNLELPPPPKRTDDKSQDSAGSSSSTSLTFSSEFSPISPRSRGKQQAYEPPPKVAESGWEIADPPRRTLKKSVSHQSLIKRVTSNSSMNSTVPIPDTPPLKVPRKQRSFQQHRLPVPAVPLQLPLSEQRASDPSTSTRKRLFSASSSRRPSQSTLALADDARSLNTIPDPEPAASTSYWIDTDNPPRSPGSNGQEYTPQQIMSPAEMLQVEASVEEAYRRPRTESIVSASTAMSDFEHDFGLSPASIFGGGRKRSNSDHPSVRSSATSVEQDMYYYQPLAPQPPSPPMLMSLPPPPRRTKSHTSQLSRTGSELGTPLSPPPRKNSTVRPKVSVEERMHRQSIMRKPSFLDIDDEMDKEPPPALPKQASFLDLTRGSFDSMRSVDSDFGY